MQENFKVLFAVDFSDPGFRAIPPIAQLVDDLNVQLTLLHVRKSPNNGTRAEVEKLLGSFFAEADHYASCRRVTTDGEPGEVIENFARQESFDLIVAPANDYFGFPRLLRSSLRGRLLERVAAPLWTMSTEARKRNYSRPIRHIAAWVDFEKDNVNHVKMASRLASRFGAALHLLHAVPVIHEGLLGEALTSNRPLSPDVAAERLTEFRRLLPVPTEVHVEVGDEKRGLTKMLRQCDADLVFLGEGQALRPGLRSPGVSRVLRALPCPAVCVDGAARFGAMWPLDSRVDFATERGLETWSRKAASWKSALTQ